MNPRLPLPIPPVNQQLEEKPIAPGARGLELSFPSFLLGAPYMAVCCLEVILRGRSAQNDEADVF